MWRGCMGAFCVPQGKGNALYWSLSGGKHVHTDLLTPFLSEKSDYGSRCQGTLVI